MKKLLIFTMALVMPMSLVACSWAYQKEETASSSARNGDWPYENVTPE
ncbi:hypothetical protein [Lutispora thermophila]|uniref:Cyclic lactone autoinducer peptide n=1 Tax=Lutispora thermophila DSM 19022 TaxID=1122184 RepID=A0A1M6EU15_9FIRM|nr:hypothetical protein [Lutispora thermophila]SHI88955.1 hypothetical protein SAMN02745176_01698 [Lutispora thermophila DSM 19022]